MVVRVAVRAAVVRASAITRSRRIESREERSAVHKLPQVRNEEGEVDIREIIVAGALCEPVAMNKLVREELKQALRVGDRDLNVVRAVQQKDRASDVRRKALIRQDIKRSEGHHGRASRTVWREYAKRA